MKDLKIPISKMRLRLICWDNYTTSPEIIHLFCTGIGIDNSFVYVMVVSWYLLSASLIGLASVYLRGTRYPPHGLLWPHHRGQCLKNLNDKPAAWGVNHIRDVHFGMVVCNINLSNSWFATQIYSLFAENKRSSIWQHCCHWWHCTFSLHISDHMKDYDLC